MKSESAAPYINCTVAVSWAVASNMRICFFGSARTQESYFNGRPLTSSGLSPKICEMLLYEGVEAYKKDGPKFIQRLVAKQKLRTK
jgi:hypothetical protein